MNIQVWSDFVCPFCYIGKRRLELALEQLPFKDDVEVEFKSFELDPNASFYSGKSIHEALASKYGMSVERAKEMNKGVGEQAASVGLTYNFDEMKPTNTFTAHRLAKFAKDKGSEVEKKMTEKLLYAYFTESRLISDEETLADIAEEVGLNRQEALEVIKDTNKYANEVRIDESVAQQYGITGVPFFIINQKYAISGAQPLETFTSALQKVWEEEHPKPTFQDLSTNTDAICTDDGCTIPNQKDSK
ncbi:DsbA family oxidoreductase [Salirhabdus sp. Marseille-P4669]|uniref:DsbA family oxidoreductase n=1 Tax=Salirhabdus sp. Marseille-P4669 TaxID=2042310 RepID=UPI000C7C7112|nr:DsbA family oxidoreductase [Salirhabdus sp. Marseille-P4669]